MRDDGTVADHTGISWNLGTIGFGYPDWAGTFYPRGVSGADRLARYAEHFNAVEIDATFHAIPAPKTVRRWADAVPEDFRFCVKTPREISHAPEDDALSSQRTRDVMHRFLEIASELGEKLSVVLVQFPATFREQRSAELAEFLAGLPAGPKYAVELRNDDWWVPTTAERFRELGVCWVAADEVNKDQASRPPAGDDGSYRPRPIVSTADFLYARWVGWHEQFPDTTNECLDPTLRLEWWKDRFEYVLPRRPEIKEIYGFFGNGYSGHAPATCRRFKKTLGIRSTMLPRDGHLFA